MEAVVLRRQPEGLLRPDDFELSRVNSPDALRDGEVRLRTLWLSIDPYQRGLLDPSPMFGRRVMVGDVMAGRGIGEVIESRSPRFKPGDVALGETGWATEAVAREEGLMPILGADNSLSLHLGILGVSGLTAYLGLEAMGGVGRGDSLLVSSAAGAVGSTVLQLAKARGARVTGVTSGPIKTSLLLDRLHADAVVDRLQGDPFEQALRNAEPQGFTCFFDNVGEKTLSDGVVAMRPRGRVLLCGYISGYEGQTPVAAADTMKLVMRQRLELKGFLVHDHAARFAEARSALQGLLRSGELDALETVLEGLGSAPDGLCKLLAGRSVGKVVVRV